MVSDPGFVRFPVPPTGPLTLEVVRGRTQFPARPITVDGFVIGAARDCDLRLGGDDMPALHSLIHFDGEHVTIETIARHPRLIINGQPTDGGTLRPGDSVAIGSFEFVLRQVEDSLEADLEPAEPSVPVLGLVTREIAELPAGDDPFSLESLSASELLERIEQEQREIDEFRSAQRSGIQALLNAIAGAIGPVDDESDAEDAIPAAVTPQESLLPPIDVRLEMELALRQVNLLSEFLDQSAAVLDREEAAFTQAVNSLLDAQQKLSRQLEHLLGPAGGLDSAAPTFRATA